jgi:ElaA protein
MTFYRLEQFSAPLLFDYLRLRTDVFVVEQGCAYPELDEWDREAEHLLAFEGQVLVACARIMGPHTIYPEPSLGRLAVARPYRHQGWGLRCLHACLERLQTRYPRQAIKIQAQQYLEEFYALAGFRSISPVPYADAGVMHVDMWLEAGR